MDCSISRQRINDELDGELGYLEAAELQQHVTTCAECAEELAQMGEVRGALAAWGQLELAPPAGFAERVAGMVAHEPAPGARRPWGRATHEVLARIDSSLGRMPLPGGRTVPVKNVIGWGLAAAAAVAIQLERRHLRRSRELKPS